MISQPQVLLYFSGELAAAAVARGGKLGEVIVRRRDGGADLADSVDELLTLLRQRAPRAWVISAEVWSQPVTVPLSVADRVPRQHLAQFLGFEVEPLSGIPAAEALTAVQSVSVEGTDRQFWVSQVENGQFERVAETVAQLGGRLMGMLHPAGVPRPLSAASATTWKRIEVWNDLVVGIGGAGKAEVERQFFSGEGVVAAQQKAAEWLQDAAPSVVEVLAPAELQLPHVDGRMKSARLRTNDEADIQTLMQAWASVLPRKAQAPVLVALRQPMPQRTRRFVAAGLVALALIACLGHRNMMRSLNEARAEIVQQEIDTLSLPTQRAKTLQSDISDLEGKRRGTQSQVDKLDQEMERYRERMTALKQRVPHLLRTLSASSDPALLVRSIGNDGNSMRIEGTCLHPQQANMLAESLARELTPLGFAVSLPSIEGQYQLNDGGPHNFTLEISDQSGR